MISGRSVEGREMVRYGEGFWKYEIVQRCKGAKVQGWSEVKQ